MGRHSFCGRRAEGDTTWPCCVLMQRACNALVHCRGENVCPVGLDPMSCAQAIVITDIRRAPDYLLSSCILLPTPAGLVAQLYLE